MILYKKNQTIKEVIVIEDKIYLRENINEWNATDPTNEKLSKSQWYSIFNEQRTKCSRYKTRKLENEYIKISKEKSKPMS